MQSDLGKQKRDKRPLISSVAPPTVSFCRLQDWFQAGNSMGWAVSSTGIPWSVWEPCPLPELAACLLPTPFGRLPGCPELASVCPYCNALLPPHPQQAQLGLEKEPLPSQPRVPPAPMQPCSTDTEQDPQHMNPPAANKQVGLLVSDSHLHVEVKLFMYWGKFHSTDQKLFQ